MKLLEVMGIGRGGGISDRNGILLISDIGKTLGWWMDTDWRKCCKLAVDISNIEYRVIDVIDVIDGHD
jgi:hypothetical protein